MTTAIKQPKSLSIDEMLASLKSDHFVVLDIETTGLSPHKGGYLIEVAAVRVKNGQITDVFDQLIDPGIKLYGKTISLTGITNEMVKGKPTYAEVLPDLFDFIGDSVIVAHNSQFDWNRFLLHYFGNLGYYPLNKAVCTKRLFQKLAPERKVTKEGYGLSELVKYYNVEFDEANHHRALDDTMATAKAFIQLRENALDKNMAQVNLVFKTKPSTMREKKKEADVRIKTVRYWEKVFGNKTIQRVYVQIEDSQKQFGTVFYDIPTRTWRIKEYHQPIDLKAVEALVLTHVKADSMEGYLNTLRDNS